MGIAGSLVARMLASLGIGILTYAALTEAFNIAKQAFFTNVNSLSADLLFMVELSGSITAINIIFAAMLARLSIQAVKQLGFMSS